MNVEALERLELMRRRLDTDGRVRVVRARHRARRQRDDDPARPRPARRRGHRAPRARRRRRRRTAAVRRRASGSTPAPRARIAEKLLDLVGTGGAIGIDASSTLQRLAARLGQARDLTVLTNGPDTFRALQDHPGVTALLTGGELDPRTGSLVGPLADPRRARRAAAPPVRERRRGRSRPRLERVDARRGRGEVRARRLRRRGRARRRRVQARATVRRPTASPGSGSTSSSPSSRRGTPDSMRTASRSASSDGSDRAPPAPRRRVDVAYGDGHHLHDDAAARGVARTRCGPGSTTSCRPNTKASSGTSRKTPSAGRSTAQFWKKQGARRWLEPTWPREYGGAEMSARRGARHPGGVRPSARRRPRGHRHAGRPDDPPPRHRRAEVGVPPRHGRGRDHVGRGLHRARLRFRPRVAAHACGARRRRVGHRRAEDVLHRGSPLQLDDHRGAHRPRRRRSGTGASATSSPRSRRRASSCARSTNIADGRQNLVFIDGLRVPADRMLGDLNQGWNQVWFGLGGNPIPTFDDDDPGPEEEYEPGPTGHAWVLDELVRYCRATTRRRHAARRRSRRPHPARRSRHRRRSREAALVRGAVRLRLPPALGDLQGVPTRVRADVHGDPRPAGPDPDRGVGTARGRDRPASTAVRSATTPAAPHR